MANIILDPFTWPAPGSIAITPQSDSFPNGVGTYPEWMLDKDDSGWIGLDYSQYVVSHPDGIEFGNIDWVCVDKEIALSWAGPPTRSFPDATGINVFGNHLFADGKKILTAPYPILGACIREVDGLEYIYLVVARDGDPYVCDELYSTPLMNPGDLTLVATRIPPEDEESPTTPWFFNESGTEGVHLKRTSSNELHECKVTLSGATGYFGTTKRSQRGIKSIDCRKKVFFDGFTALGASCADWRMGSIDRYTADGYGLTFTEYVVAADYQGDTLVYATVLPGLTARTQAKRVTAITDTPHSSECGGTECITQNGEVESLLQDVVRVGCRINVLQWGDNKIELSSSSGERTVSSGSDFSRVRVFDFQYGYGGCSNSQATATAEQTWGMSKTQRIDRETLDTGILFFDIRHNICSLICRESGDSATSTWDYENSFSETVYPDSWTPCPEGEFHCPDTSHAPTSTSQEHSTNYFYKTYINGIEYQGAPLVASSSSSSITPPTTPPSGSVGSGVAYDWCNESVGASSSYYYPHQIVDCVEFLEIYSSDLSGLTSTFRTCPGSNAVVFGGWTRSANGDLLWSQPWAIAATVGYHNVLDNGNLESITGVPGDNTRYYPLAKL